MNSIWLYPIILIAGALQAWGPPMNGVLRASLAPSERLCDLQRRAKAAGITTRARHHGLPCQWRRARTRAGNGVA